MDIEAPDPFDIVKKVEGFRKSHQVSQTRLAKFLGTSQSRVSRLLGINPSIGWSAVTKAAGDLYCKMWQWVSLGEVEAIARLEIASPRPAQLAKPAKAQPGVNLKKVTH